MMVEPFFEGHTHALDRSAGYRARWSMTTCGRRCAVARVARSLGTPRSFGFEDYAIHATT